ncbi:sensor domain-containing diguanylate cyclase [Vibrio gallaecicus]|uniref:diguanylate cyclase n=1 Tax=Vibrio gallaecicus TaxID=552386 RepID=A0ABV4NCQ0_9VIBR
MPNSADPITGLKKRTLPLLTFAASIAVTVLCLVFIAINQKESMLSNMDNIAERQVQSLRMFIKNDVAYIGSGANFFSSTERQYWDKFNTFAKRTIQGSKSLIGLQWMEKVSSDQIEAHTQRLKSLHPSYQLFTVPKDGPKTLGYIMGDQPVFIASDIHPRTPENINLLGFYSSRERFQLIIDNILETREANLSDKVRLLQDGLDKHLEKTGMLVYHPVFDSDDKELLGVVIGVVRTTYYFENLLASTLVDLDIFIRVTDLGFDAEDDPILFETEGFAEVSGHQISKVISLPNRDWVVEFRIGSLISNGGYLVLVGMASVGVMISFLLAYIVNLQVREKERLSDMLDKKTEELRFLVEHDSLTELLNRRAFNTKLKGWLKSKPRFSLVGFDIDKFKGINDQFGHPAGDALLKHVSQIIGNQLHSSDYLFRLGGDEFCILTEVYEYDDLYDYLNEILELVSSTPIDYRGESLHCTLSVGAGIYDGETAEQLLQKADSHLYESKMNGRNQVTIAG